LRKLEASATPNSHGAKQESPQYELPLTRIEVPPRKGDIEIQPIALMWLPWWIDAEGHARTAY